MTLLDAVERLDSLDVEDTIYAGEPWTPDSKVVVVREPDRGGLPIAAENQRMTYFLEVAIAREVLEDWVPRTRPTLLDKCTRLIQYATNDA
jgi:hypothetical protein